MVAFSYKAGFADFDVTTSIGCGYCQMRYLHIHRVRFDLFEMTRNSGMPRAYFKPFSFSGLAVSHHLSLSSFAEQTSRSNSRPIATIIPLFKYHRVPSLFFQMGFMPRHNGTEISIRSTNIISDYTAANGGRSTRNSVCAASVRIKSQCAGTRYRAAHWPIFEQKIENRFDS